MFCQTFLQAVVEECSPLSLVVLVRGGASITGLQGWLGPLVHVGVCFLHTAVTLGLRDV